MQPKNKITKEKLKNYYEISNRALDIIKKNKVKGKEKEAEEIILMVSSYISDAKFFEEKGDLVNSFAALSYAYGWIDCGARLGIFNVKDRTLFTV